MRVGVLQLALAFEALPAFCSFLTGPQLWTIENASFATFDASKRRIVAGHSPAATCSHFYRDLALTLQCGRMM
jgi:hypothetical protein